VSYAGNVLCSRSETFYDWAREKFEAESAARSPAEEPTMQLSPELETLYKELLLKKYKGTMSDEEAIIFADLVERRSALDTSSEAIASLPPSLAKMVGDLDGFGGSMDDMSKKIVQRESRYDSVKDGES
jgi:hypothetical protein